MFAWQHNAFQWKLALKSLAHDRIWTYIFCLSVPSSITTLFTSFLEQRTKKSYNVSVGWLQLLTMTDSMPVPFQSTKQSILDALKGVWLCKYTICQKFFLKLLTLELIYRYIFVGLPAKPKIKSNSSQLAKELITTAAK